MKPDYTTMLIVGICGALLFLLLRSLRLPDWRGRWMWIWKKKAPATPATPAATIRRPVPMPMPRPPPPASYPAPRSYPSTMPRQPVHNPPEVRL